MSQTRVDVQNFVANRLNADMDDLVLIANTDTSYTFRQKSTDQEHTAQIVVGHEGPIAMWDD